jgi:hypothetical protein
MVREIRVALITAGAMNQFVQDDGWRRIAATAE